MSSLNNNPYFELIKTSVIKVSRNTYHWDTYLDIALLCFLLILIKTKKTGLTNKKLPVLLEKFDTSLFFLIYLVRFTALLNSNKLLKQCKKVSNTCDNMNTLLKLQKYLKYQGPAPELKRFQTLIKT